MRRAKDGRFGSRGPALPDLDIGILMRVCNRHIGHDEPRIYVC